MLEDIQDAINENKELKEKLDVSEKELSELQNEKYKWLELKNDQKQLDQDRQNSR